MKYAWMAGVVLAALPAFALAEHKDHRRGSRFDISVGFGYSRHHDSRHHYSRHHYSRHDYGHVYDRPRFYYHEPVYIPPRVYYSPPVYYYPAPRVYHYDCYPSGGYYYSHSRYHSGW